MRNDEGDSAAGVSLTLTAPRKDWRKGQSMEAIGVAAR